MSMSNEVMDAELSREMRKILGPDWCADVVAWGMCRYCMRLDGRRPACEVQIEPSPAVAHALAEQVKVTAVSFHKNINGTWQCEVDAPAGRDGLLSIERWGPTRAEAECRALVALAKRKEAA